MKSLVDSSMICTGCGIPYSGESDSSPADNQTTLEILQDDSSSSWQVAPVSRNGLGTRVRGPSELITISPAVKRLLASRWTIYGVLLCCGPIGLPLLWLSPRISTLTKSAVTVLLMSVTLILPIIIYWYCCEWLLRPLANALGR